VGRQPEAPQPVANGGDAEVPQEPDGQITMDLDERPNAHARPPQSLLPSSPPCFTLP